MKVISKEETAGRLNVSPSSLSDKRYRLRIGLNAVKIGRRLGFLESDVQRLITHNREKLPTWGSYTKVGIDNTATDDSAG